MATIGIFDSGSGGLSVLRAIRAVLPRENYLYYADNANCPYGDRTAEFVRERARAVTDILIEKGAEVIVVACNTATAAAIQTLREDYDIPFIGMEPAVKPAALGTRSKVIGVLATAGTLNGSKYLKTRSAFEDGVKIVENVGRGYVELVESLNLEGPEVDEVVGRSLSPLLEAGADTVVLGCTHYPFLADTIARLAGPRVKLIDPAPAVARHLVEVMADRGLKTETGSGEVELIASGDDTALRALFDKFIAQ